MGSLWPLISNELGLTYDQEEKMKSTFIALNTPEHRAQRELSDGSGTRGRRS